MEDQLSKEELELITKILQSDSHRQLVIPVKASSIEKLNVVLCTLLIVVSVVYIFYNARAGSIILDEVHQNREVQCEVIYNQTNDVSSLPQVCKDLVESGDLSLG